MADVQGTWEIDQGMEAGVSFLLEIASIHFKPQIFFGAAAPLPGAAWPPRRGPPQRARFSFFTESYDFAAPFQIQSLRG